MLTIPNSLINRVIEIINVNPLMCSTLNSTMKEYHTFQQINGINAQYTAMNASTLLQELLQNGFKEKDKVLPLKQANPDRRQLRRQQDPSSRSRQGFNQGQNAQMHQFQGHTPLVANTEIHDDLYQAMEEHFEYPSDVESEEEQIHYDDQVENTLQVNNISQQHFQHKKDCDICGGQYGKHHEDKCPSRGTGFIPINIQHRANQYNINDESMLQRPTVPPNATNGRQAFKSQPKTSFNLPTPQVLMISSDLPSETLCSPEEMAAVATIEHAMKEAYGTEE